MIEDYRSLAIFAAVAEMGSFSGAGRHLKLSTSVVSHHISKLEDKLGIRLFFRSTRSITLTAEGQSILASAQQMVAAADDALDILTETSEQPVGALRITMPAFGDQSELHKAIWRFVRLHPMVAVSLNGTDRPVDLIKEGFDVAIRLGVLADSAMKSRRIGSFKRALVAAPSYFETHSAVKSLDDLRAAEFVSVAMLPDSVTLVNGKQQVTFEPEATRLEVESITAAKSAVLAGLGIQHLPRGEIGGDLAAGRLVEVLPEWSPPELGIFAVWPDIGPQKKLTRRFIDFLAQGVSV